MFAWDFVGYLWEEYFNFDCVYLACPHDEFYHAARGLTLHGDEYGWCCDEKCGEYDDDMCLHCVYNSNIMIGINQRCAHPFYQIKKIHPHTLINACYLQHQLLFSSAPSRPCCSAIEDRIVVGCCCPKSWWSWASTSKTNSCVPSSLLRKLKHSNILHDLSIILRVLKCNTGIFGIAYLYGSIITFLNTRLSTMGTILSVKASMASLVAFLSADSLHTLSLTWQFRWPPCRGWGRWWPRWPGWYWYSSDNTPIINVIRLLLL